MTAKILDGRALAETILRKLRKELSEALFRDKALRLVSLSVGDHPNSSLYERNQKKTCESLGVEFEIRSLPSGISPDELLREIERCNADPSVTGLIVQRPLPKGFPQQDIQASVHPDKDVEGMNPANIGWIVYGTPRLAPCTALAAVELTRLSGMDLKGKEAVVVGHSEIVGKPIAFLLLNEFVTATICHVETRDLAAHTRKADIVYMAVGKPGLLKGSMLKPGALVVDIGINRVTVGGKEKTVGDVDRETVDSVAGFLTPVPGGVGPVTVAMLLRNMVLAARLQRKACSA